MVLLRKLLYPFAVLYDAVTQLRNFLYDKSVLHSETFATPIIAVGNLSVGGTGKSPQIEYLIRLLASKYRVATLSRGYKRKSAGFILADENATAEIIGDEPYQFHLKFPEIVVAVDADRVNGIKNLLARAGKSEVILLDDAFQHRKVKAGFYILLTSYGDLYSDDYLLPAGNLREGRKGAERANAIVVTKCPPGLSSPEMDKIRNRLNTTTSVYFTSIFYDRFVYSESEKRPVDQIRNEVKVLVAGIAKPKPFFEYLKNPNDIILQFPDHHHFTDDEILSIKEKAGDRLILTTEKDYVRMRKHFEPGILFYLPIETSFIADGENFDRSIFKYVESVSDIPNPKH